MVWQPCVEVPHPSLRSLIKSASSPSASKWDKSHLDSTGVLSPERFGVKCGVRVRARAQLGAGIGAGREGQDVARTKRVPVVTT